MKKDSGKKVLFDTRLTENNKLLRDYILKKLKRYKELEKSDLLEIGIGNGRIGFLIGKKLKRYYGIEPDKEYLRIANKTKPEKNFFYKSGKAEKIPFKKKFDIVLYSFSWHFIKNHKKAIEECERILKPKGIILIIDPKEDSKGWTDKRLIKGSDEFDRKLYNKKIEQLRQGVHDLRYQKKFRIVEFESRRINLWVLKKRK